MDAGFIKTSITLSIKLTRFLEINKLCNECNNKKTNIFNKSKIAFDWSKSLNRSAKLRALRAKNLLTCQRALRAYVLMYQRVMHAYVFMCLAWLRAHVLTCFTCSRANVFCAYVLTYQRVLRAYVLTCQFLHALVLVCQRALSAYIPHISACLASYALNCWLGLRAHVLMCQHALSPLPHTAWVTRWSPANMPCIN